MNPLERIKYIEDAGMKPLAVYEYGGRCIADVIRTKDGDISVGTMAETAPEKDALIGFFARELQETWTRDDGKPMIVCVVASRSRVS